MKLVVKSMIVKNESNSPGTTALITILGPVLELDEHGDPLPPPPSFSALVINHDGCVLELRTPRSLALNLALKIQTSDAIWLGTVEACATEQERSEQSWRVVIQVSRVLRDLETIKRLADLFGSSPAVNPRIFYGMAVQV